MEDLNRVVESMIVDVVKREFGKTGAPIRPRRISHLVHFPVTVMREILERLSADGILKQYPAKSSRMIGKLYGPTENEPAPEDQRGLCLQRWW